MPIRLCIVADIHHGRDLPAKKGSAGLILLAESIRFANATRPDAVIELGDRILDVDRETDLRLEAEVAHSFKSLEAPVYHICGNHDRHHLTVADNETILGQSLASEVVDLGDWQLVLWRADTKVRRPGEFALPDTDLAWLQETMRTAEKPTAVFSHVPVSGQSQISNYFFENKPAGATYPDAAAIRAALATAPVPVACFSGHVHWNTLTMVNGQPHFTLQSLTGTFTTNPEPAASFALLELDTQIDWKVLGQDSFSARLDAAQTMRRWMQPYRPVEL
ncbi:MAG TPA: metallophosphoesterase [Devosiaceae bacterium]|jgi:hypothetical protein